MEKLNEGNAVDSGVSGSWSGTPRAVEQASAAFILLAVTLLAPPSVGAGQCTLGRLPVIPVTMMDLRPTVHAQINGRDALFIADSGAFFSFVTPAAVQEFQLRLDPSSIEGLQVEGIAGSERAQVARAKTLGMFGQTFRDVPFVVAGDIFGGRGGVAGLLGQNVFRAADVEYDLANGVIRLIQPKACGRDTPLAYWATAAHKPYSTLNIDPPDAVQPHTKAVAYLNGARIAVLFDTGAPRSLLTLAAARRAGVTPASPGVVAGGFLLGPRHKLIKTWIAHFASFKIGDEEVIQAQLRFGDVDLPAEPDMLIGTDFFLSHRIYVANSQRKLYFTYNGGPVFDLSTALPEAAEAASSLAPGSADTHAAAAAGGPEPEPPDTRLDQPTDAAGFARRGEASAARHDYPSALADLTHACELAPTESGYFYQRGVVRWQYRQADAALSDFDQAIRLRPDNADALVARASLRAARHEPAALIVTDLEAADRVVPKQADLRLRIGDEYAALDRLPAAVMQYSKWIDARTSEDPRMPIALNSRCRARALADQELAQALGDCNTALKLWPDTAEILGSRGLVYLRQGNYDKAIADYDAALRLRPKGAWSLYGRGLARLHKGLNTEGQADIAAAIAVDPKITQRAAAYGITH